MNNMGRRKTRASSPEPEENQIADLRRQLEEAQGAIRRFEARAKAAELRAEEERAERLRVLPEASHH